jgi:hypothetical protein
MTVDADRPELDGTTDTYLRRLSVVAVDECVHDDDDVQTIKWAVNEVRRLQAELDEANTRLGECYRATGEDPDGNENWRLAPFAVQAVRGLREENDQLGAELDRVAGEVRKHRDRMESDREAIGGPPHPVDLQLWGAVLDTQEERL